MPSVCFYFQVHQPYRLKKYSIFDAEHDADYFDEKKNEEICRKVAYKCYLPTNHLMLELIKKHKGKFKIAYAITGVALEQFEKYMPEVLASFRALALTGCVEFISETYYHSLAFLYSKDEFKKQVMKHKQTMKELFDYDPVTFRNTELIYNNELATLIEEMGYSGIISEGADHIMGCRSPNFLYHPVNTDKKIKLLLKNYKLSDDIAFRFSNQSWVEFPLLTDKFASWIDQINGNGEVVNLFMDYETFGEHQWEDTGIFAFVRDLPAKILANQDNDFLMPAEVISRYPAHGEIDVHHPISWADMERDLSAWLGNDMQRNAMEALYSLEKDIKSTGDEDLIESWRKLTTSDHFYYMCTKYWSDGDVHKYFSPFGSPYEGFINFMNVLENMRKRINSKAVFPSMFELEGIKQKAIS